MGPVLIVILLLVLPVIMAMGGCVIAAVLGWSLWNEVLHENEDSELVKTNY